MLELINRQNLDGAAIFVDGHSCVNYADLDSQIQIASQYVSRGDLIFLVGDNDLSSIVFYLACLHIGAVPLLLAKDIAPDSLLNLIRVYNPNKIFVSLNNALELPNYTHQLDISGYGLFNNKSLLNHRLHPHLALLLATSGSTGSPKLVRLTMSNLVSNARSISQYLNITPTDRAITSLPFNYSFGLSVIHSHLISGASIVLTNRSLFDPGFWDLMTNNQVTTLSGVPYTYEMLLRLRLERLKMPKVKKLTQAGGRLDPIKVQKVADFSKSRNINFITMYGQTEATARISYVPSDQVYEKPNSIGKAIPGGRLWIVDSDGNEISTVGSIGELIYEGPNVSMGYAESLDDLNLGDVFGGVLRTGDLARFDEDGFFFIEGRLKRFLKIFGIRVSLDAVESMLVDKCTEVAVHGHDELLVISIVKLSGTTLDDLKSFIATTLGVHPTAIRICELMELPRLSTGKVDYQCLNQSV